MHGTQVSAIQSRVFCFSAARAVPRIPLSSKAIGIPQWGWGVREDL
ncbi:hypothetical protein AB0H37_21150 [Actinomadura sp. NPDC023710]